MSALSKSKLISQLNSLGVKQGDVLFVAADLLRVGYFNKNIEQTLIDWIDILRAIVGPDGTVVIPTYTNTSFLYSKRKYIFSKNSKSNSGSLAKAVLEHCDDAIRGNHPTNSCTIFGKHAEYIASKNTYKHSKYSPYSCVVDLNGKNLLLGIVDEKNSPFTIHHAQEILGHTLTHPFSGWLKAYHYQNGKLKKYTLKEVGGCTRGAHKLWGYHLSRSAVNFGFVGRSLSALVDARKSADIFLDRLQNDPGIIKCDNKECISCYGRFRYNGYRVIFFYIKYMNKLLEKLMRNLR